MQPEMRHLAYFLAAAEELNFTKAARRLHVVPQALSTAIAQLEEIVGARLFDRNTRRVALTPAGAAFLPHARAAVEAVYEATHAARAAARERAGRLRVGLAATSALSLTPRLLRAYTDRYPDVALEVHHFDFTDPSGGLWSRESDVALVRPPFRTEGLSIEPLVEEDRYVVLPADHALANDKEVSFSDLMEEPWMDVLTDPEWCAFWSVADQRTESAPRGAICTSQDDLFEAARAHRALGLVPASVAESQAWPGLTFARVRDIKASIVAVAMPEEDHTRQAVDFANLARTLAV
jgi:DNA-binding transcriptional LysR family regulator